MKFFYRFTEIYQSPKSIQLIHPLTNQNLVEKVHRSATGN